MIISELHIYPIKSMAGISLSSAAVTDRGLENDRRWMLVDEQNRFLTLRELPKMALLQPLLAQEGLRLKSLKQPDQEILVPMVDPEGPSLKVTIWNASCDAIQAIDSVNDWISEIFGQHCKLVFMPDHSLRPVTSSSGLNPKGKIAAFADAYPFLMLGQASLNDLNTRLKEPVTVQRFRPNIVFSGGLPYQEDTLESFLINGIEFTGFENCARCTVPNVDPGDGILAKNQEPLRTLATFRKQDNKVYFGRNVVHSGTGTVRVGDEIILQ